MKERILLLENDDATRNSVAAILETAEYECRKTTLGIEVHSLFQSGEEFELMIVGITSTEESGTLIAEAKERYSDVPLVLVSAVNDLSIARNAIRKGAYDYLLKPVDSADLLATVGRALENRRLKLENRAYQANLESLVTSRTEQLRAAVAQTEKLTHDVIDAVPALRKVSDDPAAQKLLGMFGSHLDTATVEPIHALTAKINAGEPIPQVSASDIKQLWEATRRMNADRPPRPGFAIGLSVFAGYGVVCAAEPTRFMAAKWRHMLLADLIDRGLLAEWVRNGEPDERVFEAAATVNCTLEDLGRATLKTLAQSDAEFAAHATEALRAQGHDPDHPEIERRFLDLLRG